jgi:phage/plasmid-associated DNA primase
MATNDTETSKESKMTPLTEHQFHTVWTEFALQAGYENPRDKRKFQATLESLKKKKLII